MGMGTPDWLLNVVIVVSVVLALLAAGMLFVRVRPATGGAEREGSARYIDPVLLLSVLGVLVLAFAAWWLR
jgi:hypothetical protein